MDLVACTVSIDQMLLALLSSRCFRTNSPPGPARALPSGHGPLISGFATTRTGRQTCAAARVRSTESTVVVVVVINGSGAAAVAVRVGAWASRACVFLYALELLTSYATRSRYSH